MSLLDAAVETQDEPLGAPAAPPGHGPVAAAPARRPVATFRTAAALRLHAREPRGRRLRAYVLALAAVVAAAAVDLLVPAMLSRAPLTPFLAAVIVATWWGGLGPGLFALAAGAVAGGVVLEYPLPAANDAPEADAIRIAIFAAAALLAGWLTLALRVSRDRYGDQGEAAEASRSQLLGVLESVGFPVAALDCERRLLFANPAAAAFFGSPNATALERGLAAMLDEDEDVPARRRDAGGGERLAVGGQRTAWRCRVETADGRRWAAVQSAPIRRESGEVDGLVLAWRDATEDHETESAREAFMGVLAHELRTPITTIYGGAHLLTSRDDRLPDETRREVAHDILHEATRLNRIAENLLVLSRVERGQLEILAEPILVEPLVRAVVGAEAIRWPATHFVVELETTTRRAVSAAPAYVEQVLRNLLSNAAKYSAPGATVRAVVANATGGDDVAVRDPAAAAARADRASPAASGATAVATVAGDHSASREIVVRIEDEGPGFAPVDAERLFELYYRAPDTAVKAPGSGIGLYVCRRLIEAMGGRIWATGEPSRGAVFAFTLPIDADGADDGIAEAAI